MNYTFNIKATKLICQFNAHTLLDLPFYLILKTKKTVIDGIVSSKQKKSQNIFKHVANFTHSVGLRQINSLVNSCAHL